MHRVLVIDDDGPYRAQLVRFLRRHAFRPIPTLSAYRAITLARKHAPRLILLKWADRSDRTALRLLRRNPSTSGVPIMAMASLPMDSAEEEVLALHAGADFFFSKSEVIFNDASHAKPLLRHFRALILRGLRNGDSIRVYHAGDLRLDAVNSNLTIGSERIHLVPKELALLESLIRHPDALLPAKILWRQAWATRRPALWEHTLSVTVSSLRRKLGPKWGSCLVNTKRHGYRLILEELATAQGAPSGGM